VNVTFDFLYVFTVRENAEIAVRRLTDAGFQAKLAQSDGEGRVWQARAERSEDFPEGGEDEPLEEYLDRLDSQCDALLADLHPTDDGGSGFGYDEPNALYGL
jgi:hypothetical protein